MTTEARKARAAYTVGPLGVFHPYLFVTLITARFTARGGVLMHNEVSYSC